METLKKRQGSLPPPIKIAPSILTENPNSSFKSFHVWSKFRRRKLLIPSNDLFRLLPKVFVSKTAAPSKRNSSTKINFHTRTNSLNSKYILKKVDSAITIIRPQ